MSSESVIAVENLGKCYQIYNEPHHRLLQTFFRGRKQFFKEFWALKDVSFEIRKGECIGIIGRNGCGKSTLLQILAGTLSATTGQAKISGRVSALLELGSGFNPEFTGRENVYMSGAILGISRAEMKRKFDVIEAFADIGEFIEQPVKMYSSGMYVRLAFAAAISVDPEILIIDEALAVGDVRFQQKCFRKFKDFKENDKTILFVSHDMSSVKTLCNRAFWLDSGRIKYMGMPEDVCKKYISFMSYGLETEEASTKENSKSINSVTVLKSNDIKWESTSRCDSFGDGGAAIIATALYSKERNEPIAMFEGGEDVVYYVKFNVKERIESPIVGFILNDDHGVHLLGYNNRSIGMEIAPFQPGETHIFRFEFNFPRLKDGLYLFSPAVAEGTQSVHVQRHWVHDALSVQIASASEVNKSGPYFVPERLSIVRE